MNSKYYPHSFSKMPLPRLVTPSGIITIPVNTAGTTLSVDVGQTGTGSGLSAPPLPTFSTDSSTTVTASPSSSPSAIISNGSTLKTGGIIGIIVGLFLVLAIALIVFMTIRHRKRIKGSRTRALVSARKSWSRLHDGRKPAEVPMRETNLAQTASVANTNAVTVQESFPSLTSTRGLLLENPYLGNSTHQHSASESTQGLTLQSPTRSTDHSHIPNPFSSTTSSSSCHSSTPSSNTLAYSSHGPSLPPAALSSFAPQTRQYSHPSMVTASTTNDYISEFATLDETSAPRAVESWTPAAPPAAAHLIRKDPMKPAEDSRSRELRAMLNLISALDERAQNNTTASSANTSREHSRLSMGDDLVSPGGHSIRETDTV